MAGMTVGEVKAALADVDDDVLVVMDSDAEGNKTSPLAQMDVGHTMYDGSPYWGETYDTTDPYYQEGGEAEIPQDAVPCVRLVPVN